MDLTGTRIAVLVEREYEDLELWYPLLRLREAGAETVVVGTGTSEIYASKHGYVVKADETISTDAADRFDAVVIPGGWAPDRLRRSGDVVRFVRMMVERNKVVAAICHGGSVLVSAGVLQGRRVTGSPGIKDDLVAAGARFADSEVVRDGNLISSRSPADLPAFCRETIAAVAAWRQTGAASIPAQSAVEESED